jgi:hypothetical protein
MSNDLVGSSFLGSNSNFFMPESRSISFAVEEEDPWSAAGSDPVDEIRQPLMQSQTMDEDMVIEGLTAANVLGKKKKSLCFVLGTQTDKSF